MKRCAGCNEPFGFGQKIFEVAFNEEFCADCVHVTYVTEALVPA